MRKKYFAQAIILLLTISCFTVVNTEKKPDKNKRPFTSIRNNQYKLNEKQARQKIGAIIQKKFGQFCSFILSWWPFKSEEQQNSENLVKKEIQEINTLAQEEIDCPDNYKRIVCQEPFVRYIEKTVKKPVKKVIVEWKECKERVPVTDFRAVRRRRWHEEKLKTGIFGKIVTLLSNKAYAYAIQKTGSPVIADLIRKKIATELIQKIESDKKSLTMYLGKAREAQVEEMIQEIVTKEHYQKHHQKKENTTSHPSNKCVRCLKSFKQAKRVYLYPCGHNICAQCFKACNTTCPICRRKIERGLPTT